MTDPDLHLKLSQLLRETASAHQATYPATEETDPDWAIWYADYLLEPMQKLMAVEFHKSQLIYCLMNADFDFEAREPDCEWAEFYANEFIEHFAASETAQEDQLALYYMAWCSFCRRVMAVIERLELDIEMRDVLADGDRRAELVEARGRQTVPVLWIKSPDGSVRWIPESQDIIHYLETTYG